MSRDETAMVTTFHQSDPLRSALRTKLVQHREAMKNAVEDFQAASARLNPERFLLRDPVGVLLVAFCVGLGAGVFSKQRKQGVRR